MSHSIATVAGEPTLAPGWELRDEPGSGAQCGACYWTVQRYYRHPQAGIRCERCRMKPGTWAVFQVEMSGARHEVASLGRFSDEGEAARAAYLADLQGWRYGLTYTYRAGRVESGQ